MTRLLSGLLIVFVFLLIVAKWGKSTLPIKRTPSPIPNNPHLDAFVQDYAQFVQSEMHRTQTPGVAVVIVKDSNIIFMKGFGVKSAHGRDSVNKHTLFRIGSLSKGFAGILTAMLAQDNMLNLNDPVIKYIPNFQLHSPAQTQRIQLRHLLSHSTGLPYHTYTNLIEAGQDIPTIAAQLKNVRLVGKEGEVFSYQNAAFALIEEVIRNTRGITYPELLKKNIFQKTGMYDASTSYEAMIASSNKAYPHDGFDSNWVRTDITPRYYNTVAAGGINASISDMGQWLLLLLGNRPELIEQNTLDEVFAPLIKTNNERRFFSEWSGDKEAFYGLGWRILHTPQDTIIYHGGYVNSYKGEIALHRTERIGVCVLMNGAGTMSEHLIPTFFDQYRKYANAIHTWKPEYH